MVNALAPGLNIIPPNVKPVSSLFSVAVVEVPKQRLSSDDGEPVPLPGVVPLALLLSLRFALPGLVDQAQLLAAKPVVAQNTKTTSDIVIVILWFSGID